MKTFKGVLLRVWVGLLFYALQYDHGNWITYQSPLQMTGNSFFLIGVAYLCIGWCNAIYEHGFGQTLKERTYTPYESGERQKWLWFYSSLVFLIPAVLITFYISFIKA